MATTEDITIYFSQEAVVPPYDPANPYSVLDTPTAAYDALAISTTQNCSTVPPRGY